MADDNNAAVNAAMMAGNMYGPNPYSQFPNGIQSTSYAGWPTDAMGNPIKPPPGMTLNSTPAQPPPAPSQNNNPNQWAVNNAMISAMGSPTRGDVDGGGRGAYQGVDVGNVVNLRGQNNAAYGLGATGPGGQVWNPTTAAAAMAQRGGGGPQIGGGGQSGGGSQGGSYEQALALLSNPGKVTTPGATVPQTQPVSNQPSVLDQFLANQRGGQGAGNYSNNAFFNTLNRLRGNPSQMTQ